MRAEPVPRHCPWQQPSRTIPVPPYHPSAHHARWHTSARAEPAPMHCPERQLSHTIPVPSHSPVLPLARWRTAAQGCTAPAQHLGQPLAPTTVALFYNPAAHPARRQTSARVGSAPTRSPAPRLSHTSPAPSHSPASHLAARCHTVVQVGSAPIHFPGHPASSIVADLRLRSCPLKQQAHAREPVPSVAASIQAGRVNAPVWCLPSAQPSKVAPFHLAER